MVVLDHFGDACLRTSGWSRLVMYVSREVKRGAS